MSDATVKGFRRQWRRLQLPLLVIATSTAWAAPPDEGPAPPGEDPFEVIATDQPMEGEVVEIEPATVPRQRSEPAPPTAQGGDRQFIPVEPPSPAVTSDRAQPRLRQVATSNEATGQPEPTTPPAEVNVEAANFKGLQPGVSSTADVETTLGAPQETRGEGDVVEYVYQQDPFDQIIVTCLDGRVQSIVITLAGSFPPTTLAKELGLAAIVSVVVPDDYGTPLGQVFPERGVLFTYDPRETEKRLVSQVILDPVDAQPFVLRAEFRSKKHPRASLRDLKHALDLDPNYGRAHWIRAKIMHQLGDIDEAKRSIATARRLEPQVIEYRLTSAAIGFDLGEIDSAIEATRDVATAQPEPASLHAEAWLQLGNQLASGRADAFAEAIAAHQKAIEISEPLLKEDRYAIRNAAAEVLLDAHLAVAYDVAHGAWRRKDVAIKQWIARAEKWASRDAQVSVSNRFRIAAGALAAQAGMEGELDPSAWIEEVQLTGKALINGANDQGYRDRLQWQLGLALADAVDSLLARGDVPQSLEVGQQAAEYCQAGLQQRQPRPQELHRVGNLYFRLGSMHALGEENHHQAIVWFDRAAPLLEQVPPSVDEVHGTHRAEAFVSMGVSYWKTGATDEALRLTELGARLMQYAVDHGKLDPEALEVPYGNLANMHHHIGNDAKAEGYRELAERPGGSTRR